MCVLYVKNEELIVEELNSRKDFYNIEKCMQICEKRSLKLPLAYLKMWDGNCEESIQHFIEILKGV